VECQNNARDGHEIASETLKIDDIVNLRRRRLCRASTAPSRSTRRWTRAAVFDELVVNGH
jgi:hypothetical protein